MKIYRKRRLIVIGTAVIGLVAAIIANPSSYEILWQPSNEAGASSEVSAVSTEISSNSDQPLARDILEKIDIKGRAPKTGYARTEFYQSWPKIDGCNLRQRILRRELGDSAKLGDDNCTVTGGEFDEPYTGAHMIFYQKGDLSDGLQIDHVVALSDAWQKGAQYMDAETRYQIATDPLNLLAVESKANQAKSDGDAATWLPPNKAFRCQYVARQVSVKYKYNLWMTQAEHDAIVKVLEVCPNEPSVGIKL